MYLQPNLYVNEILSRAECWSKAYGIPKADKWRDGPAPGHMAGAEKGDFSMDLKAFK